MQETWVPSLGREDFLEVDMATHSSILAWKIPMDRGALWAIVHRVPKELGTAEGPNNRKHLQRASYAAFDSYNNPSKWTLLFPLSV